MPEVPLFWIKIIIAVIIAVSEVLLERLFDD